MYPPVHTRPTQSFSYDRLNMLWDKYPQFHSMTTFSSLETLMEEHESYQKDFDELREEYESCQYDRFLVQLSWADLPYRYATKELLESASPLPMNSYVESFMSQFEDLDTDHQACFLFPESFVSQFFVVSEVCKRADIFHPIRNLFPDEEKLHYIAVFDKKNITLCMITPFRGIRIICVRMELSSVLRIFLTPSQNTRAICRFITIRLKRSMFGETLNTYWNPDTSHLSLNSF